MNASTDLWIGNYVKYLALKRFTELWNAPLIVTWKMLRQISSQAEEKEKKIENKCITRKEKKVKMQQQQQHKDLLPPHQHTKKPWGTALATKNKKLSFFWRIQFSPLLLPLYPTHILPKSPPQGSTFGMPHTAFPDVSKHKCVSTFLFLLLIFQRMQVSFHAFLPTCLKPIPRARASEKLPLQLQVRKKKLQWIFECCLQWDLLISCQVMTDDLH